MLVGAHPTPKVILSSVHPVPRARFASAHPTPRTILSSAHSFPNAVLTGAAPLARIHPVHPALKAIWRVILAGAHPVPRAVHAGDLHPTRALAPDNSVPAVTAIPADLKVILADDHRTSNFRLRLGLGFGVTLPIATSYTGTGRSTSTGSCAVSSVSSGIHPKAALAALGDILDLIFAKAAPTDSPPEAVLRLRVVPELPKSDTHSTVIHAATMVAPAVSPKAASNAARGRGAVTRLRVAPPTA